MPSIVPLVEPLASKANAHEPSPLQLEMPTLVTPLTALPSVSLPASMDASALETSSRILNVIDRYRLRRSGNGSVKADEGALKFLALIYSYVKSGVQVPMCLPAFPFKSPNSVSKVLGKLPDRAEEVALAHLNGLCLAIKDIYLPGARLTIISDGLVYNDLLGVPDQDVWAYGETLRALAKTRELDNITFSRLRDLVSIPLSDQLDEMAYVANASNFRRALLNTFSRADWTWKEVSEIEDVCLTYRGYIKFLQTDLETVYPIGESRSKSKYKRGIELIAKEMMARGDAFASAVRQKYGDHVRLSIHPSSGASKLSIGLLPTSSIYTTPWHCAVAYKLDGTLLTGMRSEFENDTNFELVYENDRPSYFREKSELFHWAREKGGVVCEPIYPSGWMIKPARGPFALTMNDVDGGKVRALAERNSPVVMRGFVKRPNLEQFVEKSHEIGKPLPWKFGLVLKVQDKGSQNQGLNNVLSSEWMPFHFDGLFKTVKKTNEKGEEVAVSMPPQLQIFVGATPSPKDTGFTLFASSTLFFKYLPDGLSLESLSSMTWSVSTPSFEQTELKRIPLVTPHCKTGKPCLRYHESWPQSKTSFDPTIVKLDNLSEADGTVICRAIDSLLHDRRVTYHHAWEKGDIVLSDNQLMLHTRSDFKSGGERELWRIHLD